MTCKKQGEMEDALATLSTLFKKNKFVKYKWLKYPEDEDRCFKLKKLI
jgi:hypothetical protein